MKSKLFIIFLILTGFESNAQIVKRPLIIESRIQTGTILPFYKALSFLIKDDIYAIDLSLSFPTFGKDYWEKLYRFPKLGLGYSFWSLGNNEVLGKAHCVYGNINVPLIKKTEKFSLDYQISFGGAYLTKIFDPVENHLNRAISSHTNLYIRLGIDGRVKITPLSELVLEMGATHFSNGKTRSPNYGINAGTISLGLNYLINSPAVIHNNPEVPEFEKKYVNSLIYSAGSKVYDNLLGTKYFVSSISYNIERLMNQKRRIGLGADLSYDGSISEALSVEEGITESDFSQRIRFGLHVSHAVRYKQLIMGIQVGHYLYSKFTVLTPVYNKISVQYLVTSNLIGSISIKSHWAKADCLEWGIGYYW